MPANRVAEWFCMQSLKRKGNGFGRSVPANRVAEWFWTIFWKRQRQGFWTLCAVK